MSIDWGQEVQVIAIVTGFWLLVLLFRDIALVKHKEKTATKEEPRFVTKEVQKVVTHLPLSFQYELTEVMNETLSKIIREEEPCMKWEASGAVRMHSAVKRWMNGKAFAPDPPPPSGRAKRREEHARLLQQLERAEALLGSEEARKGFEFARHMVEEWVEGEKPDG